MLRWMLCWLVLSVAAAEVAAASFVVNPVRVSLAESQRVISLTVRNNGSERMRVQAQPMRWLAEGEDDQYEATDQLLVSPPLFALEPGSSQILRVGLRNPRAGDREQTYRLYLTEVPGPLGADFEGLAMTLRLGIPIFVQPSIAVSPALAGNLTAQVKGFELQVDNRGLAHARLIEALFLDSQDAVLGKIALSRDVLAGQQRKFLLDAEQWPMAARVRIRTDPESAEFDLAMPHLHH